MCNLPVDGVVSGRDVSFASNEWDVDSNFWYVFVTRGIDDSPASEEGDIRFKFWFVIVTGGFDESFAPEEEARLVGGATAGL